MLRIGFSRNRWKKFRVSKKQTSDWHTFSGKFLILCNNFEYENLTIIDTFSLSFMGPSAPPQQANTKACHILVLHSSPFKQLDKAIRKTFCIVCTLNLFSWSAIQIFSLKSLSKNLKQLTFTSISLSKNVVAKCKHCVFYS